MDVTSGRCRYDFNNEYCDQLEAAGLVLSGLSPDKRLVEMIEWPGHPYFVACQFHPEFKSRPMSPHPLFFSFIQAALRYSESAERKESKTAESATWPGKRPQAGRHHKERISSSGG